MKNSVQQPNSKLAGVTVPQWELSIRAWATKHNVPSTDDLISSLQLLQKDGLPTALMMLVLELLRAYADRRAFEDARQNFEEWQKKAKSLARRLRSIVPKAREILIYLDLEFVESLSQTADNVEDYPKLVADMEWGDPFGRSFAGTTCFLVLAVKLIERLTGREHYREVANIVTCITSGTPGANLPVQERSEGGLRKAVDHFTERESGFVDDFLKEDSIEKSARVWIRSWHSAERRLTNAGVLAAQKRQYQLKKRRQRKRNKTKANLQRTAVESQQPY